SLAVLPLENLSGDPEQEYFVDGMHEELIATLGKIGALKVISRTSVMQYKQQRKPLPEIARELGVDAVIEGSVRRAGDQVRITVQLVDARADKHLWAESYQRQLRDVLALQSEVAQAIANEIKVNLTPTEQALVARARPVDPEAHEAYLKGRYYWNKRSPEGLKKGLEYFQEAIEKDPAYPVAYVGLADTYEMLTLYGVVPPTEAYPRAKAALAKALELDDTLGEAHASLASLNWDDWDWRGAEREYRRALEVNPNYPTAHHYYAVYLSASGRYEEAIKEIRRARELDPLSPIIRGAEVMILFFARKHDEAIRESHKALEIDRNFGWFHGWRGAAYLEQGMFDSALADFEQHAAVSATSDVLARLGYAYGRVGRRADALKIMRELEQRSKREYVSSFDIALVYIGLGDRTEALAWLERAYQNKEGVMWLTGLKVNPWFDGLRDDPRFQDLLRRMNFPE
ncbi:MAG TPA: tetratricopeptide repeat protein, partial [Candidatus Acidoferrales bacterium]|nr:tetratricopeptide repeat protein [Candidatus Acidoferrales bacterium]